MQWLWAQPRPQTCLRAHLLRRHVGGGRKCRHVRAHELLLHALQLRNGGVGGGDARHEPRARSSDNVGPQAQTGRDVEGIAAACVVLVVCVRGVVVCVCVCMCVCVCVAQGWLQRGAVCLVPFARATPQPQLSSSKDELQAIHAHMDTRL
jgi:hypothetical protein